MKYFIIAGEASGDLHASHLMRALADRDPHARFYFYGGDEMSAAGGTRLRHYKSMAYMGIIPVLLHLPSLLRRMAECKHFISHIRPDVVILVDYPSFNLKIASFVKKHLPGTPVFYYISPKIWAWKEWRIRNIKRDIDALFSILPFERAFFEQKHHYPIHYVGNPTVDEVSHFLTNDQETKEQFTARFHLHPNRPIIALLAGSRKQEIRDNLLRMCLAARPLLSENYQLVVAGAPSIADELYESILSQLPLDGRLAVSVINGATYPLLKHATVALVTSGTATLETALFNVPQVVCYYMGMGRMVSWLRRHVLKVPYISLVNLVCRREVVPELVADGMNVANLRRHLLEILPGQPARQRMLEGYQEMRAELGKPGAPEVAATEMIKILRNRHTDTSGTQQPEQDKNIAPV